MGTRGLSGFVIDGEVKAQYQQYDSYPSGVGYQVVDAIKSGKITPEAVRSIVLVGENTKPTAEQIERLSQYANTGVSTGSTDEWYVLLRETQGDLLAMLDAGHMIDSSDFAADSLFCEWAYLVNLDTNTLEVYRGFVNSADELTGRFSQEKPYTPDYDPSTTYYPITLVREVPLSEASREIMDEIEKSVYGEEE